MVTSASDSKTRLAASGSHQMLNSALGVTLPSPIAPPMTTMSSMFSTRSGYIAISSAMLVSGPTGMSVSGRSRSSRAISSTAWIGSRLARRRRQVGPVEARLAVHLVGHAGRVVDQRAVRARRDRHGVGADHVEHPDGVRRDLVQRLVSGHGRDGHDLQLRACEREHQGHRIVVARVAVDDHRRLRHGASFKRAACSNAAMHDRRPPSQRRFRCSRPPPSPRPATRSR